MITGAIVAARTPSRPDMDRGAAVAWSILRVLLMTVAYALAGLLIGAGVGYGVDYFVLVQR